MSTVKAEALIIGAGVIGSGVAYHLSRLGMTGIHVIDPDLEGSLSSSELNAGGVRATFSQPINIEMSKLSIEFFEEHGVELGYRGVGYLWLKTPETMAQSARVTELQRSMGWEVEQWDPAELRAKVPFIDKTDDLAGALFAPRDGLVNPNLVKNYYRSEARKRGVSFDDRRMVIGMDEVSATEAELRCRSLGNLTGEQKEALLSGATPDSGDAGRADGSETRYRARVIVNCAGPWAGEVAKILGYESPTRPLRRQVSIFDCRDVDLSRHGMIVDTSGVYFHPEATGGLAGFAVRGEEPKFDFQYGGEAFFSEHIWPALYERSSGFERLKHLTGWAGLYEVSPDESAIIGRAQRGKRTKFDGIFEAHSFSGHGVMHSYAAGLAASELVVKGKYETIDVGALSAGRFLTGRTVPEGAVI